ncbi:MAG: DUF3823 domain-containing protein [Sphingobacteriaceae bacterium]|nr:MAG: DUF3823 domain-containing protein [Sphingobacteriaceae bacterium]
MKRAIYFTSLILLFLTACSKTDTYDLPNETLIGVLEDADGNPYITEQPNGFQIKIIENGSTTPREFWGMADGKFNNTKIFKGTYKIVPVNGAFFPVDTVTREISGVTNLNFTITPYLKIDAAISQYGPDLKAVYKISQAPGAGKITNVRILINKWNPAVGMNFSDKSVTRDLSGTPDATVVQTEYTDMVTDYLESGVTYYARVAVLSENSLGKYNFSTVSKIVVP